MVDEELKEPYAQQNKQEVRSIVKGLTLFDDDLMSRVFDQNIPATELFLKIILGHPFKVCSVIGQDEMKNPEVGGRNITLDVHAVDEDGKHIDIEVQGDSKGAHIKRARYHSSALETRMLRENEDFKNLADSYVIFMYKHDKFGKGFPMYHLERFITETMEPVKDGSHIIYINGRYKGDDPVGRLISDFHQEKSEHMYYKELADGLRHFKETEEGCEIMCESVERYGDKRAEVAAEEATKEERLNSVRILIKNMKISMEQALDALEIYGEERTFITEQIQKNL